MFLHHAVSTHFYIYIYDCQQTVACAYSSSCLQDAPQSAPPTQETDLVEPEIDTMEVADPAASELPNDPEEVADQAASSEAPAALADAPAASATQPTKPSAQNVASPAAQTGLSQPKRKPAQQHKRAGAMDALAEQGGSQAAAKRQRQSLFEGAGAGHNSPDTPVFSGSGHSRARVKQPADPNRKKRTGPKVAAHRTPAPVTFCLMLFCLLPHCALLKKKLVCQQHVHNLLVIE